jgi:membrane-associated phospholipid phosphatase
VDVILKLLQRSASRAIATLILVVMATSLMSYAQTSGNANSESLGSDIKHMPANLVHDQYRIWTSPARLKLKDATWLVPVGGIAAGMIATDRDFDRTVAKHTSIQSPANTLSNAGLAAIAGGAGGFYLWGAATGDPHKRETGLLSSEALVDSLGVVEVLKYAFHRDRPNQNLDGHFFRSGTSFPSGHAILSFSAATVIANEYPGWATQTLAYGAATAVSMARVAALQHFPSDVFVGGTLGYLIGRSVYRNHHDQDLPGAEWGTFERTEQAPHSVASPYVPLDSWVYPAIERLAAMGYVQSEFLGQRPWTRVECERLVEEAADLFGDELDNDPTPAAKIYQALQREFAPEGNHDSRGNPRAEIERVYARVTGISGEPVRDGYHFSQTFVNDLGRPYGEGANVVTGVSGFASAGPLLVYATWEYQHSAQGPLRSADAAAAISQFERQAPSGNVFSAVDRGRLLDAYVAYNWHDYQLSFGKQSLWWGPGEQSALLFSNNAEPVTMFRVDKTTPQKLPSILGWLGPLRIQFFVGQLSGHELVNTQTGLVALGNGVGPQPFLHGQKVSFHPTQNFEFSVSRTAIFGGPEFPFTPHRLFNSLFSRGNTFGATDPGDRRSSVDFTYRIPKLRKWLTFYTDAMAEDEISPIGYPRRSAFWAGIYVPQLPRLQRLDFRAEGGFTDLPAGLLFPGFYYFNVRYLNGYTNAGSILGSWVGREGHGVALSTRYWLSPDSHVQFSYRAHRVDPAFLAGGSLTDFQAGIDKDLTKKVTLSGNVQYERWSFPLLATGLHSDTSVSVQVTFKSPFGTKQ